MAGNILSYFSWLAGFFIFFCWFIFPLCCSATAEEEQMTGLTTVGLNLELPSDSVSHSHREVVSLRVCG